MPQFGSTDGYDTVALITGPSHVLLGIRFSETPVASFELAKRPAIGTCSGAALDEARIINAINAGLAAAVAEIGSPRFVSGAFYIADDSPRYDLYQRCAYLLASRR
jgi:hypothetical protein